MGILELSKKFAAENAKTEGIKLTLKVIDLLKQKKSPSKIAKELDIDIALVKEIAATQK